MTKRAVHEFFSGAGVYILALTGFIVGCHEKSISASDSETGFFPTGGVGGSGGASGAGGARVATGGSGPLGACHAEPDLAPSLPGPTELDPDLVARAAALIGSCMPDDGVARNAAHLWLAHLVAPRLYFRFAEQLHCFAHSDCGCAAVEHCLDWVYREAPAVCESSCQGDVFTGCGDEVQITMNCRRFGLDCDPAANCVNEAPVACESSEVPTCTARGEVQFCDDHFMRKTPCQSLGFSCVAGKCLATGATCAAEPSFEQLETVTPVGTGCSGDTLQACLGGHSTSIDCSSQGSGFSCQSRDEAFFCGLAAECIPANNYSSPQPVTCEGTRLSFCNAGRLEHLDCTTLGFTGCDINSKLGHYGCTPGAELQ